MHGLMQEPNGENPGSSKKIPWKSGNEWHIWISLIRRGDWYQARKAQGIFRLEENLISGTLQYENYISVGLSRNISHK